MLYLDQNTHGSLFENIVYKTVVILFRFQWINIASYPSLGCDIQGFRAMLFNTKYNPWVTKEFSLLASR